MTSPAFTSASESDKPPTSCVGWWDSVIGLIAVLGVFFALRNHPTLSDAELGSCLILIIAATIGLIEIARAPWLNTAPSAEAWNIRLPRVGIKLLGQFFTLAVIAFFYWLFPEYHRAYYKPYLDLGVTLLPWALPVIALYFLWAEWRIPQEKDGNQQVGLVVLGRWRELDAFLLKKHILSWMVKGYFLAIMFGDLVGGLPQFRHASWDLFNLSFLSFYQLLFNTTVSLELAFVASGYLLSCRLFNSQIKAVESTLLGWFIALISYGPFLGLFYSAYLGYQSEFTWGIWLKGHETLLAVWGSIILVLMVIHMWADACFGLRFSNLTHRGIITNGAYRFSKHPAYFIKSIRWWLVAVPFAAQDWETALRSSLLLTGVCLVYMVRAYTEEKLLSQDPTYIDYALWMDRHGWLRWTGKLLPILRYENRLKKWRASGELKIRPREEFLP